MKTKTHFTGVIIEAGMDEDSGEPRVVLGVPFEELQSLTTNPLFKVCDVQIRLPKPKPPED